MLSMDSQLSNSSEDVKSINDLFDNLEISATNMVKQSVTLKTLKTGMFDKTNLEQMDQFAEKWAVHLYSVICQEEQVQKQIKLIDYHVANEHFTSNILGLKKTILLNQINGLQEETWKNVMEFKKIYPHFFAVYQHYKPTISNAIHENNLKEDSEDDSDVLETMNKVGRKRERTSVSDETPSKRAK